MHVGFGQKDGKDTVKEHSVALSNALELGLTTNFEAKAEFEAGKLLAKAKSEVKAGFGTSMKNTETNADVQRAMDTVTSMANSDQHTQYKTECIPDTKDEGRAGLWQWVIATADKSAEALTDHTVCRTGILWNTPPKCNYWECFNASCEVC